jgi:hypothetical protein
MHIPPPGMVRNSGPHLDQTLDEPVHGALHCFAPDIKLADHMQEVVGQNTHLQPSLVRLEPLATGLVPAQGIFAFLDPVFHIAPAIVYSDHFTGRQSGVGHHKTDPGEQLSPVSLDLDHYPAGLTLAFRLIVEINYLDLNSILGRTAHRSVQVRGNQLIQVVVGR